MSFFGRPARRLDGGRSRDLLTPLIVAIAAVALLLVGYDQLVANRIARDQLALTPVADGVANRVSLAHLDLIQALGGDHSVDVNTDVFGTLRQARDLIQAAQQHESSDSTHDAGEIQDSLRRLFVLVERFGRFANSRWQYRDQAGQIGAHADRELDDVYTELITETSRLADLAAANEAAQRDRITRVNFSVLAILPVLFLGVAAFSRRARRDELRRNEQLEERVAERTAELARNEARTSAIVTAAVDAIVTADAGGRILTVNPATTRMFGFSSDELVGQPVTVLMTIADRAEHESAIRRYLATGQARIMGSVVEASARRKDGSIFPIDLSISEARAGDDTVFIGVVRDITERKRAESDLQKAKAVAEEAATRDSLTGLWNHNRIIEILDEEMARADRQRSALSLAMMDLDRFKQINDKHGHLVGDEVLREVAKRLADAVRAYDSVGRFGGEEFMIVLPGADVREAAEACERVRRQIGREPVVTSCGMLALTASLGVVTRVGSATHDATDLLVAADTALYRSKEAGRDRVTASAVAGGVPD